MGRLEDSLANAEAERKRARLEDPISNPDIRSLSSTNYHLSMALYNQNEAIIILLQKISDYQERCCIKK